MREIKFRAWDKRDKKYWYILGFIKDGSQIRIWWKLSDGIVMNKSFNESMVILEQYTGHEKWCQNDIIRTDHYVNCKGKQEYLYHQIVWSEKYLCWFAKSISNYGFDEMDNGNIQLWVFIKNSVNPVISGNIREEKS